MLYPTIILHSQIMILYLKVQMLYQSIIQHIKPNLLCLKYRNAISKYHSKFMVLFRLFSSSSRFCFSIRFLDLEFAALEFKGRIISDIGLGLRQQVKFSRFWRNRRRQRKIQFDSNIGKREAQTMAAWTTTTSDDDCLDGGGQGKQQLKVDGGWGKLERKRRKQLKSEN